MSAGLYVPGKDGGVEYKEFKQAEDRPVMSYEEDTGRILINFNIVLMQHGRALQDISILTHDGSVQGVMITSSALGPEAVARLRAAGFLKP
jgi:hypothetical protein